MNLNLIRSYIDKYKNNFDRINRMEIYKWYAVKCFQDNWNIEAKNFSDMLEKSISQTKNLLASGLYYPRKMLLSNAKKSSNKIRKLFINLYEEEEDIIERMKNFRKEFDEINKINFPGKNSYQDPRAIIVYLTLKYPERYFLYKHKMFKAFAEKINYDFPSKADKFEKVGLYYNLCNLIRGEIIKDQNLLKLHKNRIDENCYYDENLNLLTQDFIYAVTRHLDEVKTKKESGVTINKITEHKSSEFKNSIFRVLFEPKLTNYAENERENKRIGDLGELWVIEQEKKKLQKAGKEKLIKNIVHLSKQRGDGAGYDILSFNDNGEKIFIEVKTTKGNFNRLFYITRTELERSIQEDKRYYLYRVYNFNENNNSAKIAKINGSLEEYCNYSTQFKVKLNPLKK